MEKPKILVVEDERVVAADIEESLRKLGYKVIGSAATGLHAIRCAVETDPDLVLMDIKLSGTMDGIDAAGELHDRLGIPVVFLTAYADGEILERAKKAVPSGYVLKPFDERALRSAVELALDRHPRERRLVESERRLVTALRGLNDAVAITGRDGRVTFLNRAAERLTGWKSGDASGRPVHEILVMLNARTGSLLPDVVARALRENVTLSLGGDALLLNRFGGETRIEGSVTPLSGEDHTTVGALMLFRSPGEFDAVGDSARRDRTSLIARLAGSLSESIERALEEEETARHTGATANGANANPPSLLDNVRNAAALLRRFHTLAQPRIPRPRRTTLTRILADLQEFLNAVVPPSIAVNTAAPKDSPEIALDPVQLQYALLELIFLCGERMPFGGKITLETDTVELLPEFARNHTELEPGTYAVLSVSHAGSVLIPPAENLRDDVPSVLSEIRGLGGDMQVRSEPGRLTTYDIYLPCVAA